MFSNTESEDWGTSSVQDAFIKDYFKKQTMLSVNTLSKGSNSGVTDSDSNFINIKCHNKETDENILFDDNTGYKNKRILNSLSNHYKKKKSVDHVVENDTLVNCQKSKMCKKRRLNEVHHHSNLLMNEKKKHKLEKNKTHSLKKQTRSISDVDSDLQISSSKSSYLDADMNKTTCDEMQDKIFSSDLQKKKNCFQSKIQQKLQAAKFRYLNEMLYTNSGKSALKYFQENEDEFQEYHIGYQSQVSKWPINPVNIIIKELHSMAEASIIADLGCGEAKIAEEFPDRTVHSFDLIAIKDCITACNIANVPLPKESVNVAVFCLSLMGTNWKDYLREGHRILKLGGLLKIAEIESRFDNLNNFMKNIESHGFSLESENVSHKMFVFLNFKKIKQKFKNSKTQEVILKPCLYKKR